MANIHFIIKCPGTVKEKLNNSKEFTIFLAYRFGRNTSFQYKTGHKVPAKFWNLPEWKNTFKRYLRQVQVLLKKYDEKAIIRAIQKNKICTLFSKV